MEKDHAREKALTLKLAGGKEILPLPQVSLFQTQPQTSRSRAPTRLIKSITSKSCTALPTVIADRVIIPPAQKQLKNMIDSIENNVIIPSKELKKIKNINLQDHTGNTILLVIIKQLKMTEDLVQHNATTLANLLSSTDGIIDLNLRNHNRETIFSILKTCSSPRIHKLADILDTENKLRKSMERDKLLVKKYEEKKIKHKSQAQQKQMQIDDRRKSVKDLVDIMKLGKPMDISI